MAVYFIRMDGSPYVKVGTTQSVKARLGQMRVDNPLPLTLVACVDGGYERERAIHRRLRGHHHRGEWYCLSDDDVATIARSPATLPIPPPRKSKDAIGRAELRAMVAGLPKDGDDRLTLISLRDRALLLLGWQGAFRRSELVALDVEDLPVDGIRAASDRMLCPVRAVDAWREASGVEAGALLRAVDRHGNVGRRLSRKAVARRTKIAAAAIGLDAARIAGHSLRSGRLRDLGLSGRSAVRCAS